MTVPRKKLIEVALPLGIISEAAAKEKKIETRGYQPASEKPSAKAIAVGAERSRR